MIVDLTWEQFKVFAVNKSRVRYVDRDSFYRISYVDGAGELETSVLKDGGADQVDFETNYLPNANKPSNLKAEIEVLPPFAAKVTPDGKKLYKRVVGIQVPLNQGDNSATWVCTYAWAKFMAIEIIGGEIGDYVSLKVLDSTTGQISGYPNITLNQFGFSVNVGKDFYSHKSEFDADIYAGLQLRFEYHSISSKSVGINLVMNEVKNS